MVSFRDLSVLSLAGNAAVLVVGLLAFAGVVGLRFQRRGAARFWAAPAALALCLLPLAVGVAFAGLLLRQVLAGLALTGAGGVAAIAAGCTEALLPILVGLGVSAALTACAFLATAVGSSKSSAPASSGLAGWALSAVSLLSLLFLGGLVWLFLSTVALLNGPNASTGTLRARLGLSLAGAFALVAVTFVSAVAASFLSPRGPSGIGMKLVSLASLALCGLMCVAGLWAAWSRSQALTETALTGLREGELPEPAPMPVFVEPSVAPLPPPPPPPAHTMRAQPPPPGRRGESTAVRRTSDVQALRVGGTIREPRKIRNVSPVYPDIAKQARVQGIVILEATIGPRGDVTSVTVLRGIPLLDQSAMDAVKQWVYEPTLLNGVPVPVIMTVTVRYQLSEK
jgi:protein TonB